MRSFVSISSFLTGAALLAAAVASTILPDTGPGLSLNLPLIGGLVLAGILLLWLGLLARRSPPEPETPVGGEPHGEEPSGQAPGDGEPARPQAVTYRHTYRLFTVVTLLVVVISVARRLVVPEGFGEDGYYRAQAPKDSRRFPIRHVTEARCTECHDDQTKKHDKDLHFRVACEQCHGPGHEHAANPERRPRKVRDRGDCLVCHQRMLARPPAFPQVTVAEHYKLVGVKDPGLDCVVCHNPHEPLFLEKSARSARLHPRIHRCRDCHSGRTDETLKRPPDHPSIFQCDYCHGPRVRDFQQRKHHKLRCTTCHIYIGETENTGRIVRKAGRRFCLLCHRKAPFRSEGAPPGIQWKEHPGYPGTDCLECHQDAIHGEIGKEPDDDAKR